MDDSFLAEQLERMRRLSERMSQIHSHVERNSELISRDRDLLHSTPLHEVGDCRPHQTQNYEPRPETRRLRPRSRVESSTSSMRASASDSSRRRRRR
jgi:hypothetical protein